MTGTAPHQRQDLDRPHDPQPSAIAHLAGELDADARQRFESHLLGCEACWTEVRAARDGRVAAESLRDPAPQDLREYLRALAACDPAGEGPAGVPGAEPLVGPRPVPVVGARPFWSATPVLSRAAALVAGAVLAGGITVGLLSRDEAPDQAPLLAAAASYRADLTGSVPGESVLGGSASSARPPRLSLASLPWQGTVREDLAGQPATVYRYGDASGRELLLISSARQFPRAKNAQTVLGTSWSARIDGAAMFCVDHGGLSWLVIGDSAEQPIAAGHEAGLA